MSNRDRNTQNSGIAGLFVLALLAVMGVAIVLGWGWLVIAVLVVEIGVIALGFLALCLTAIFKPEMWR